MVGEGVVWFGTRVAEAVAVAAAVAVSGPAVAVREGGVCVVWWWWSRPECMTHVFLHTRQRMHLIGTRERLGVRLPASPSPPSPRAHTAVSARARKNGHLPGTPGTSAKNAKVTHMRHF